MQFNENLFEVLIGFTIAIVAGLVFYWYTNRKKSAPQSEAIHPGQPENKVSQQLQMQAYERLTLLADRIALPNLVVRIPPDGNSATNYQLSLLKSIRDEFDYNITQQIYVSPESWQAVKKLKEKNMLFINQIAQSLPPGATAMDLSRSLLHFCMQDEKGSLHDLVSEALSHEARKLM
jgi:hypothetical protein